MIYNNAFLDRLHIGLTSLLPQWGFGTDSRLTLLTISENATFKVEEISSDRRLILRVHRPGYSIPAEIESELQWLHAVKNQGEINVAASVPMVNGEHIAELRDGDRSIWVVGFEFISGREPGNDADLIHWYRRLGETAGHLHHHSQHWVRPEGFTRKTWRFDTIIGQRSFWGDWRALEQFTPCEIALLSQVEGSVRSQLDAYGESEGRFGLVHSDMRLANLLVEGDRLAVIDFDDCGICWFGWDFATAVSFIEDDARLSEYCRAWVEGYRQVRSFSSSDEQMLSVLVMLRRLQLTAWIASHSETPTAQQFMPGWGVNTLMLARKYLDNELIENENLQDA